jgi:molybdate transport system ATP-binding protein
MTRLEVELRRRLSADFTLDVSFAFTFESTARIAALFGPSGCGKSTTLALIAGLAQPDAGRVVLDGRVLADVATGAHVPPHLRAIGLVHQDGLLFPHLDVAGNLSFAERRASGRRVGRPEVVAALRLEGLLGRSVGALSGGERQRVALGRALLSGPRLLLLDEPISALDEKARWEVLGYVEEVANRFDVPALYVSHQRAEVARLASQVARLDAGRVTTAGETASVLGRSQDAGGVPNILRATFTNLGDGDARLAGGVRITLPVKGSRDEVVWCQVSSGAITLQSPSAAPVSGARNRLAGTVQAVMRDEMRVRLVIEAAVPLHVDVTPQAAEELHLKPGAAVVCTFKTHSIEVLR